MPKVFLLLLEDFVLVDALGPLQVFAAADDRLLASGGERRYRAELHALRPETISSANNVPIPAAPAPLRLPQSAGTLVLVGGAHPLPGPLLPDHGLAFQWLVLNLSRFRRLASIGQDAFLLAQRARSQQGARRLGVSVLEGASKVIDATRWMSVNAGTGLELALAIVRDDLGEEFALAVAGQLADTYGRRSLLPLGGSFSTVPSSDHRLDRLHDWIRSNIREFLPVRSLATQMAMTPRTFSRHYLQLTGETPAKAVLRLRLEGAALLVCAQPRLSLKTVAQECGFASEEVMRRAFVRRFQMSPSRFRAKGSQGALPPDET
jgi:transcriptional regulator GlxA family with amidase domain